MTGEGNGQRRINDAIAMGAPEEVIEQVTEEVEGTFLRDGR